MATEQEVKEAAERVHGAPGALFNSVALMIDCRMIAAHALRPEPAIPEAVACGIAEYESALDKALRPACEPERAIAQQPDAYLTRDGFPVGLEESVEEHAEPLYRGAAPGVLIGWREIPGGCEIMTREYAYNLYGDDIEPVYAAASPSAPDGHIPPVSRALDKEQAQRIISHINDRCSKSKLASPSINISRDGWQMIVQLLEDACTKQS